MTSIIIFYSYFGLVSNITFDQTDGIDVDQRNVSSLTDNNFEICERVHPGERFENSFEHFMDFRGLPPEATGITVVGNGLTCGPDGMTTLNARTDDGMMACKASSRARVCYFNCQCMHMCYAALVTIRNVGAQHGIQVCELLLGKLHVF